MLTPSNRISSSEVCVLVEIISPFLDTTSQRRPRALHHVRRTGPGTLAGFSMPDRPVTLTLQVADKAILRSPAPFPQEFLRSVLGRDSGAQAPVPDARALSNWSR